MLDCVIECGVKCRSQKLSARPNAHLADGQHFRSGRCIGDPYCDVAWPSGEAPMVSAPGKAA
jgi:hypothetical protein